MVAEWKKVVVKKQEVEELNYNKLLKEGLKVGDLKELIIPTISIDEYESKVDEDAVVVGFFVKDKEPANDLSTFIETSGVEDLIDTDVSPATDEDGNYAVFAEFVRTDTFPQTLKNVLESLQSLTGIENWDFTFYGSHDEKQIFNEDNVAGYVRLKPKLSKTNEHLEFFRDSTLSDVIYDNKNLILEKNNTFKIFETIAFGEPLSILSALELDKEPLSYDSESLLECNRIRNMLGHNWDVNKINRYYIFANSSDSRIVVVK